MTEIRLGCNHCDRQDFDGIQRVEDAQQLGWTDIQFVPSSAWIDPDSGFNWETHIGICPDCQDIENGVGCQNYHST